MIGKEKILCIVVVLLLGALAYFNFPQEPLASARANDAGIKIPKIAVPEVDRLKLTASKSGSGFQSRNIFQSPRDTSPLPPLAIELPPIPRWFVIAPPVAPSVRISKWSSFYRVPAKAQPFEFTAAGDSEKKEEAPAPAASAPTTSEDLAARAEGYKKTYDWLRPNPNATLFGKIQNPNAFDLGFPKLRDTESILFQEIFPESGKLKGKPTPWPPERVVEYGFADTIANQIEIKKRKISYTAGNLPEIIAFADWCVEQGAEEPRAFLEAERVYKLATQLDPGDPSGQLGLGRLYERSFQLEEAYELYRGMAEGKFSHRPEPYLHLGKLQARLRLFGLAEASLKRAVDISEVVPAFRTALGQYYLERGRVDEAVAILREMKMEAPDADQRAYVRNISGEAFLAAGEIAEASNLFKQALNTKADYLDAQLGLASSLYAKGSFDEGLKTIDAALAQGLISPELYTARGIFEIRMGQFAAAERDLKSAIGINPLKDFYPHEALAFLYLLTGHPGEAQQEVEAAYTIDPTDAYLRYFKAFLLMTREDFAGAQESIDSLLNVEVRFMDGLYLRGQLAYLQGKNEEAERYFTIASEIDPKNAEILAMRAVNFLKAAQVARASELAQKALSLNPDQPTALNTIAYCAYIEGRSDEAIRSFAEMIDRHKENDEYRQYAEKSFADIQDHLTKVLWTDNFERTELRREWKEEARFGPLVRIENGSVVVDGIARDPGRTRLYRELAGRAFLSFESAVSVEENNQSVVGLQVVAERKIGDTNRVEFEIDIARMRNGKVATRIQSGQVAPEWVIHEELSWPAGKPVKLAVERLGSQEDPKIRIWFNDTPIGDSEKFPRLKSIAMDLRLGVFAETEAGRQVSLKMDDVRMVYREK